MKHISPGVVDFQSIMEEVIMPERKLYSQVRSSHILSSATFMSYMETQCYSQRRSHIHVIEHLLGIQATMYTIIKTSTVRVRVHCVAYT